MQYRASGRSRRFTIGLHGALTADEARREAKGLLGQVAKGEDPAEERATRRGSMTVAELCDAYLAAADKGLIMGKGGQAKKASTLYVDRGRIERHIKPLLGRRLVAELTAPDVQRFVRDVQAGKTAGVVKTGFRGKAVVEGGPGTAARTVGLLGGILSYAVSERVITINPATGVKRPADKKRKRRLTPDEYAALGKALAEAEEGGAERWQAVAGVRLLALTGCRLGEIVKLRWSEVDRAEPCLRLEDSKEGASVRPISKAVLLILDGIERPQAPSMSCRRRGEGRGPLRASTMPWSGLPAGRPGGRHGAHSPALLRLNGRRSRIQRLHHRSDAGPRRAWRDVSLYPPPRRGTARGRRPSRDAGCGSDERDRQSLSDQMEAGNSGAAAIPTALSANWRLASVS